MEDEYVNDLPEPEKTYLLGNTGGVDFRAEGEHVLTSREVQGPLAARIKVLTKASTCAYDPKILQYDLEKD